MPEKKIIVRAWYMTGPPQNKRLLADFIGTSIRSVDCGVYITGVNAWGIESERFIPNRDIEKIWEE